jgi:S1-C subfamily serine protease
MASLSDLKVPPNLQPNPADYAFDLQAAMRAVVGLRAIVPEDAFTAQMLGTERAGNGVVISDHGLVLTIGYLITEAETIWLTPDVGPPVEGHALAYDAETGFGLVQALARLPVPAMPIGSSAKARVGDPVVVAGVGGLQRSIAASIVAKQEFAGYWEYVLDEAIFTAPAHPNFGGTALIGDQGQLLGVGSLKFEHGRDGRVERRGEDVSGHLNLSVPIDLLKPIFDDLLHHGRPNRAPRPWLGFYAAEVENRIMVIGIADRGPAQRAGLRNGDIVRSVSGEEVRSLAALFRRIWACGPAGVDIPFRVEREGRLIESKIASADRSSFFKTPRLH